MALKIGEEFADWIVCLKCLHVWHTKFGKAHVRDAPCTQCGEQFEQRRLLVSEVTHALRRHMPRAIKQYTMKATKKGGP